MKVTKIINKKVLDSNVNEVGKVTDIELNIKENSIEKIYLTTNEISLKKDIFEITPDMVFVVGDYLLLNVSKKEIEEINSPSPDVEVVDPKELEDELN